MAVSDPTGDMLTRIRNAYRAGHRKVDVPASNLKKEISRLLAADGFIHGYAYIEDAKQGVLRLYLKYDTHEESVIRGIRRISKPGRRKYVQKDEIPKVLNGLGIAILSTSKGVMTDKESRAARVGGEVLCYVW